MRRVILFGAVIALCLTVGGCSDKPTEPTDQFPPLISWNTPIADQLIVTDTATVRFTAADDGGVISDVKVYIDGALAVTLTTAPYEANLDFSALGNNRASFVYATASDPTGKVGVTADTLKFTKALPPDTAVWTKLSGFATEPMPRYGHTMSLDRTGQRAVLFAGYNVIPGFTSLNDAWVFHFGTNTWEGLTTAGTTPEPRRQHAAGIVGNTLIVFGGQRGLSTADSLLEDYALLDLTSLNWIVSFTGSRPQPSRGLATAVLNDELYLYGGSYDAGVGNPDENSATMWRFSLVDTTFALLAPTGQVPNRRFNAAMAPDFEGNRVFLYGGRSGLTSPEAPTDGSNYRLNATSLVWSSSAVSGPPPLEYAVAIYDSLNNRILMWGGSDAGGTPLTKLWQFSLGGRFWTEVPTSGPGGFPAGRTNFGMVKDPDSSRAIMFGGLISGDSNGETWELSW